MPIVSAKIMFEGKYGKSGPYNFKIRPELAAELKTGDLVVCATRFGYSIAIFSGLETVTDPVKEKKITKSVLQRVATEHDI